MATPETAGPRCRPIPDVPRVRVAVVGSAQGRAATAALSENYEWRLCKHLLPFFCDYAIADIDVALVERYREHKVIERERVAEAIAAGEPAAGQPRTACAFR